MASRHYQQYMRARGEGRVSVQEKFIRCSSACSCNGGQGHGPYRYAEWWDTEAQKPRSLYLSPVEHKGKGRKRSSA